MKSFILIFFLFFIFSCHKNVENKFPIVSEFNHSKNQYKVDTIDLENVSNEGGELIGYYNDSDELVLDFFIYGETGKLNYTFFTNKKLNYHFVVKKNYKYDRPIYEKNMKTDSSIIYLNYDRNPKLFDKKGDEIQD